MVWTQAFGHKTSLQKGGPFSFPDASYFQKTGEQLDALGVPVPPREVTTPVFEVIRYLAPDQLPAPKTATTPTSSPSPLRTANSTPPRHMASPGIPDRPCALCQKRLSARSAVQLVDCKHALHLDCLSQHLHKNPCCPIQDCRSPPLVRQGTSPSGTMTSQVLGVDWIKVAYDIPPGKQLPVCILHAAAERIFSVSHGLATFCSDIPVAVPPNPKCAARRLYAICPPTQHRRRSGRVETPAVRVVEGPVVQSHRPRTTESEQSGVHLPRTSSNLFYWPRSTGQFC